MSHAAFWQGARFIGASSVVLSLWVAEPARAAADGSTRGTVTVVHLNSEVSGRGVCIQMTPSLPAVWNCLSSSNALYKEITALLYSALYGGRQCTVGWKNQAPGNPAFLFNELVTVECG
jgi:hypothetical protein